jgi:uncharacterized protein (DUF433 family)
VIIPAEPKALSFQNLIELHVLAAVRRHHRISLLAVRNAVAYLRQEFKTDHPLADRQMHTDGKNLFVEHLGKLVNVSGQQQILQDALTLYLQRIDRSPRGIAIKLYPFTSLSPEQEAPKAVVIDPALKFGRPCLVGTGVPTAILAERFRAGDTIRHLAEDYGIVEGQIEEALRYEQSLRSAA